MGFYMNKIVKGIALAAGTYVACGLQYHKIDQTEYLISKKSTIITSTHYSQVKTYGKANENVLVSSVE